MEYSSEENLIIQSTCNAVLLSSLSLNAEGFLQSDFFKELDFVFPNVKTMYTNKITGIGNQGMLLVCLYSLLVLPRELILEQYPENYKRVNEWIDVNNIGYTDTYSYLSTGNGSADFKHIRHLRNAVSHGNVEFSGTNPTEVICEFKDENYRTNEKYSLKMAISKIGELVVELVKAQQGYIENIIKKQQEAMKK